MSGITAEIIGVPEEIPIEGISINKRRGADPDKVAALVESIKEIGLLHPIGVTKDHGLIHGRHRVEAFKGMGLKTIPAMVHDLDDLHAELAEIDENLQHNSLTVIEEADALARRKEIFEALHPEVKHGGDRKSTSAKSNGRNGHLKSFTEDAASKTGRSARSIRRDVAISKALSHSTKKALEGTPVANNKSELERISKLPEGEQVKAAGEAVEAATKPAKKRAAKEYKPVRECADWEDKKWKVLRRLNRETEVLGLCVERNKKFEMSVKRAARAVKDLEKLAGMGK